MLNAVLIRSHRHRVGAARRSRSSAQQALNERTSLTMRQPTKISVIQSKVFTPASTDFANRSLARCSWPSPVRQLKTRISTL